MTGQPRRRSALADEHPAWSAPARPDPAPTPPPAPAPPPPPPAAPAPAPQRAAAPEPPATAVAPPAAARGRSRDRAEARGRKLARDAAYAWAVSAARTEDRLRELAAEIDAAIDRGTPPQLLAEFLAEACARSEIDLDRIPTSIRTALGID